MIADMPNLLKIEACAERMNVSKMTVYRLIDEKQLTAYRIGRSFRVDEADLETYLEASKIPSAS